MAAILFPFKKKNGQKRPFFAFQPISLDSTRERTKNMRKGTLWTFPDHIPPKGKRKKPLAAIVQTACPI
jgi:hypothetical protein